jgi:plasmid maintenance system antidote protein VapI
MKLKEYLDETGIPIARFARKINVSPNTIHNVIRGKTISLKIALEIERITEGKVKCKDLISEP